LGIVGEVGKEVGGEAIEVGDDEGEEVDGGELFPLLLLW